MNTQRSSRERKATESLGGREEECTFLLNQNHWQNKVHSARSRHTQVLAKEISRGIARAGPGRMPKTERQSLHFYHQNGRTIEAKGSLVAFESRRTQKQLGGKDRPRPASTVRPADCRPHHRFFSSRGPGGNRRRQSSLPCCGTRRASRACRPTGLPSKESRAGSGFRSVLHPFLPRPPARAFGHDIMGAL